VKGGSVDSIVKNCTALCDYIAGLEVRGTRGSARRVVHDEELKLLGYTIFRCIEVNVLYKLEEPG
jgi:hypothetical protein